MARVYNWQIGREMSYWYPESRPRRQFAAVFDTNKCIACQTCTLACKTTWTSGKGQEYMLWNNVETKPYGFYPLAWDLKLLDMLGGGQWRTALRGPDDLRVGPAGERVLGWRPESQDYAYPNVGEDDCAGQVDGGAEFRCRTWRGSSTWRASATTAPTRPASPPVRAARSTSARRRHRARRSGPLPRLPGVREGLPVQEGLLQPDDRHLGEVHRLLPEDGSGAAAAVLRQLHRQDPHGRVPLTPDQARADNPLDYLVHVRKSRCRSTRSSASSRTSTTSRPSTSPRPAPFLRQMFGPGVDDAIAAATATAGRTIMRTTMTCCRHCCRRPPAACSARPARASREATPSDGWRRSTRLRSAPETCAARCGRRRSRTSWPTARAR
jgi:nitrate reductase / nitrite oxidoreductase, beta subunit